MTQSQFMYELMKEISFLSDEEKINVMNDYTLYFSQQINKGLTEEEACGALCSPAEIADSYRNGAPLPILGVDSVYKEENERGKTPLSVFKFICLIPAAVVYLPVVAVVGLVLFVMAIALCAVCVGVSVFSFTLLSINTAFIFVGIGMILFTVVFLLLSVLIFRATIYFLRLLPGFMKGVLQNKRKARAAV